MRWAGTIICERPDLDCNSELWFIIREFVISRLLSLSELDLYTCNTSPLLSPPFFCPVGAKFYLINARDFLGTLKLISPAGRE